MVLFLVEVRCYADRKTVTGWRRTGLGSPVVVVGSPLTPEVMISSARAARGRRMS